MLLLTTYELTASFGLLLSVSLQSVGRYSAGEEIDRVIPGYKRL